MRSWMSTGSPLYCSPSVRRTRPWICVWRRRVSTAWCSLRRRSPSSTDPVLYVGSGFHPMDLAPFVTASRVTSEYGTSLKGDQDHERAIGGSSPLVKRCVWMFDQKGSAGSRWGVSFSPACWYSACARSRDHEVGDDGNALTEPQRFSSDGAGRRHSAPSELPRAKGRVYVRSSSAPPVG
jgi:hypothetical protein